MTSLPAAGLGVLAFALLVWFFPRYGGRIPLPTPLFQDIPLRIHRGFQPQVIVVEQGWPVKLRCQREDDFADSGVLRIPSLGIERALLPFATTTLDLQFEEVGSVTFFDAGLMTGTFVVRARRPPAPR